MIQPDGGFLDWVRQAAAREGLRHVILSGGCFINGILCQGVMTALYASGLNVHLAQRLPANDGGLSLGQAWVGVCAMQAAAHDG